MEADGSTPMSNNTLEKYRSRIAPVPAGTLRPLWSVMIPTYHCAPFLHETLARVLIQDPGPGSMHIEVVDDHSIKDDPRAVVNQIGRGRIDFYRQPANGGHTANFNTCLQRSRGKLIHLLHGDDYVLDGFYETMQEVFEDPRVGAAFCRQIVVDEDGRTRSVSGFEQPYSGILDNWLEKIALYQRLQMVSMVVRRDVYEKLGGFDRRIASYGEDWEMWIRIAAHHRVWYEVKPLAVYRMHSSSLSAQSFRTGQNIRDLRQVIAIYQTYLPSNQVGKIADDARQICAIAAVRGAYLQLDRGDWRASLVQLKEALFSYPSLITVVRCLAFFMRWARFIIRKSLLGPPLREEATPPAMHQRPRDH